MTYFTPAAYPMHGVFRQEDGNSFQLLLAGYRTDDDGLTEPVFMGDLEEVGSLLGLGDIANDLISLMPGFPNPSTEGTPTCI